MNHLSLTHSKQQVIGGAFHRLNNQSNLNTHHTHLLDVAYYSAINHFTADQKATQIEKDFLLVEEDEENEQNHFAKKSIAQSSHTLKKIKFYKDAEISAVAHGVPFDEHLNCEKVYLLYQVFRI